MVKVSFAGDIVGGMAGGKNNVFRYIVFIKSLIYLFDTCNSAVKEKVIWHDNDEQKLNAREI